MYHPTSIGPLSESQILKALKGLPVRVSAGNQHNVELSKEQLKKFAKAQNLGKAMNITLDPFQIQNHMKLIGSGVSRRKKYNNWVDTLGARQVIDAGMSKGASTISGMGVGRRNKYNKWVDALGARDLISSGMSKGASTISGSGNMRDLYALSTSKKARNASEKYGPDLSNNTGMEDDDEYNNTLYLGGGVGRRNKYNNWVDALGARQVIDAGMSKGASTISGMGVGRRNKYNKWVDALGARDLIQSGMSKGASTISGFGLKKRGRPRKTGGALYVAGS